MNDYDKILQLVNAGVLEPETATYTARLIAVSRDDAEHWKRTRQ